MKRMFVVRGSEDGNLGIFSTPGRAFEKASKYLNQNGPVSMTFFKSESEPACAASRRAVVAKLNDNGYCQIEVPGQVACDIEMFVLNQD